MKDAAHHLKHIQKKVIKSNRQETRVRWRNTTNHVNNVDYLAIPANSKAVPKSS